MSICDVKLSRRYESGFLMKFSTKLRKMARVEVVMPKMGESIMEGTVIEWTKKVGDSVEVDETLLEIATDKVDSEVPSPEAGVLIEILAEEGETIEVGEPIAIIETDASAAATSSAPKADAVAEEKVEEPKAEPTPEPQAKAEVETPEIAPDTSSDDRYYSPLVLSIAKNEGINRNELASIPGTGKDNRVTKSDIISYLESRGSSSAPKQAAPAPAPAPTPAPAPKAVTTNIAKSSPGAISAGDLNISSSSASVDVIKMDRMRKMIADHMVRSKATSAHVTTFAEVDVTNLVKLRANQKAAFQKRHGVKLTFTPFFIQAAVQAIREFPLVNSSVIEDEIHVKHDINFGVAVSLGEGGQGGLVVPVIKQAQNKNLVGLASDLSDIANRARSKSLSPDDLVGGTFTLTNYGSVGNLMGTPIINQPQVAILGTGAIVKKPVVLETAEGDVIAIRHCMYLSMSYDHRIIDGAHGGAYLQRVCQLLEAIDPNADL
jgi:2-oxoglutarate dehydrogenase dihydrolipoamide succinyltransferase (E2 component)